MISEESCDSEDWSNVCFLITGINYIWKYIEIENGYFKMPYCISWFFKNTKNPGKRRKQINNNNNNSPVMHTYTHTHIYIYIHTHTHTVYIYIYNPLFTISHC